MIPGFRAVGCNSPLPNASHGRNSMILISSSLATRARRFPPRLHQRELQNESNANGGVWIARHLFAMRSVLTAALNFGG